MIDLHASVRQPVSAAARREAGYVTTAFPYVPGWVLRGALAASWIREHGEPSRSSPHRAEFIDLFEGSIRFGALVAVGTAFEPLSVVRCKYPRSIECQQFEVDLVAVTANRCAHCGGSLEALKGALRNSVLREHARVALDQSGRALDGQLFTREEIPVGSELQGCIAGEHPWLAGLQSAATWFGGRRSTAGRADITATVGTEPQAGPTDQPDQLVIRCVSPMISLDRYGRAQLRPANDEVAYRLGVEEHSVRLVRQFVRPTTIGGWHMASGLPKPRELAAVPGSTFVFSVSGLDAPACQQLAGVGLGQRTREGFGWIEVNPPSWSAPRPRRPASPTTVSPDLDVSALCELAAADRAWAISLLRERLLEIEQRLAAAPNGPQGVFATARFVLLNSAQRQQLSTALETTERRLLNRCVAVLRGVS